MSPLTELRLRETGRERKCMHPLRNEFGWNALIVAVLPANDFALLRLAPILRQFICGITPWFRGQFARGDLLAASSEIAGEHVNTNNRDDLASTRRESGKLRVLIVVATAYK